MICLHEWYARPSNLISEGSGCPECYRRSLEIPVKATHTKRLIINTSEYEIYYFDSIKEATDALGIYSGGISKCLAGKLKSCKGWRFEKISES
jgi:hypothetical protein